VAVEFLRRHGVPARPIATQVVVSNAALLRHIEAGESPTRENQLRWESDGSWSLGIGNPDPDRRDHTRGFDGHLVAVVNEKLFIDLSIDQASRPDHDIVLGPVAGPINAEWLKGHQSGTAMLNGSRVVWTAQPQERAFLSMRGWTNLQRLAPVLDQLDRLWRSGTAKG
jgi:hypothetical protein